jgi:hypothetical protein
MRESRKSKATQNLNLNGLGLEIGPSHCPILPKKEGYKIEILDHLSSDDLKIKYRAQGISEENLNKIEDVDYIWKGEAISELTKKDCYYDFIICSHVIEHIPDLISYLIELEKILCVNGVLSLVIPNKQYTFDTLRNPTSTGALIQAFLNKATLPSPAQIFDHFSLAVYKNGNCTWGPCEKGDLKKVHSLEQAFDLAKKSHKQLEYIDIHNWVFTIDSFVSIITDLNSLNLVNLEIKDFNRDEDSDNYEFFIQMYKRK